MKKIYSALTILLCASALECGLAEDIAQQRIVLEKNKKDLEALKKQLIDTNQQLQKQLLDQVSKTLNETINPQLKTVQDAQKSIAAIPKDILSVISIGKLPEVLTTIVSLISNTSAILSQVSARFGGVVNKLSPQKDPTGMYKDLDASIQGMEKSLKLLKELEDIAKAFED